MFNRRLDNYVPKLIEDEVYNKLFEHYKDSPTFTNGNMKNKIN